MALRPHFFDGSELSMKGRSLISKKPAYTVHVDSSFSSAQPSPAALPVRTAFPGSSPAVLPAWPAVPGSSPAAVPGPSADSNSTGAVRSPLTSAITHQPPVLSCSSSPAVVPPSFPADPSSSQSPVRTSSTAAGPDQKAAEASVSAPVHSPPSPAVPVAVQIQRSEQTTPVPVQNGGSRLPGNMFSCSSIRVTVYHEQQEHRYMYLTLEKQRKL
jgi:hypothetical protein